MNWLEVEGPLHDQWPPASYQALFGNLPFDVTDGQLNVVPNEALDDAKVLLTSFYARAVGEAKEELLAPFVDIYEQAVELGEDFTTATITAMRATKYSGDRSRWIAMMSPVAAPFACNSAARASERRSSAP